MGSRIEDGCVSGLCRLSLLAHACCLALTILLQPLLSLGQSGAPFSGFRTIPFADYPPEIDGKGDEWSGDSIFRFRIQHPVPTHANQLSVQLQWDAQSLYLYAEIEDDRLVRLTSDSSHRYLNDAVELYLDPLDDSGNRMDINDYQYIVDFTGAAAVLKGDKASIQDTSKTAPKELGIATVAFQCATTKLLDENGEERGYSVEMSVPFAAMGAVPKEGMGLKIDFCVDDADSMVNLKTWPDTVNLPLFFCSNWEGYLDFSFPDHWRHFRLVGGPSPMHRIGNLVGKNWVVVILALVSIAGIVIYVQARRIAELKDVMPRRTMNPGVVEGIMAEPSAETQAAMVANDAKAAEIEDSSEEAGKESPLKLQGAKHPVVARCRQVVLERLDQDLMMEELASECAVSLRQLQRIFKDEMGMGPGSFVVIIKMERAAELLRSGQYNVSEAAWALGFQDGSYFSRVFKKYHGVSPKSFMAA